ncbi:MAG TPA: hypothetical protein VD993_01615 [Chitinophagaceae bacterium]|nr:hypothetical protein [Chitinophagaceae bacterium]
MKKGISILLLATFFLFQTGRILLYFECRFSNSITTSSCDCAQILTDNKQAPPNEAAPVSNHAGHRHLPEEFEKGNSLKAPIVYTTITRIQAVYIHRTGDDYSSDIFHPPLI